MPEVVDGVPEWDDKLKSQLVHWLEADPDATLRMTVVRKKVNQLSIRSLTNAVVASVDTSRIEAVSV
jgi:hypothetical protein